MNNGLNWFKQKNKLPDIKDTIGIRKRDSEVVLVYVGDNDYSNRECTLAYYNHSSGDWIFLEDKYSDFHVIYWSYLPTKKYFETLP